MSTRITCQFTGCDWAAEHASEAVAIAMLTSHSQNHRGNPLAATTKQKTPKIGTNASKGLADIEITARS